MSDTPGVVVTDVTAEVERIAREGETLVAPANLAAAIQDLRHAKDARQVIEKGITSARNIEARKRDAVTEMLTAVLIAAKDEMGDDFEWFKIQQAVNHHKVKA